MSKIKINNNEIVNGNLSISRGLTNDDEIVIAAILATHKYFEDITEIETERYHLTDVKIIKEDFGSNDFNIQYTLSAEDLDIKGGVTNLSEKVIDIIEQELYKEEYSIDKKENLIHKEVYDQWKSKMN